MEDEKKGRDRVFIGPPGDDGSFPAIRVSPGPEVAVGRLTPAKDGVPAFGRQLVRVSAAEDGGLEMETVHDGRGASRGGGPAMVNSEGFRSGWDAVFGAKADRSLN